MLRKSKAVIRHAEVGDLLVIKALLQEAKLPNNGLEKHIDHLFVLESGERVLGAVGFEAHPPYTLLRSLVVAPEIRGQGQGWELLEFILKEVKTRDFLEAYALTTTIPNWFLRVGFEEISRQDIPKALHVSEILRACCCASASVFKLRL